jgi:hypothetical protein
MDLREIGIDGANWIWLTQGRVRWRAFVSTVMNRVQIERRLFFGNLSDHQLFKEYHAP